MAEKSTSTCAEATDEASVGPHQAHPVQEAAKVSHTPLPWRMTHSGTVYSDTEPTVIARALMDDVGPAERMANAEFIVCATNAHYDLVAACEVALTALTHHQHGMAISGVPELISRLESAVKKATRGLP